MNAWVIIRHSAELQLALDVWHMFETCHDFHAALAVIRDAGAVSLLGIVTATSLAANGFCGIVGEAAKWLRLAEARRLPPLLRGLWTALTSRRRRTRRGNGA